MSSVSESSSNICLNDFSSARRIFALSQVKQVALELGDQSLVSQINRVISFDHETMHLEALWRHAIEQYPMFISDQCTVERIFVLQRSELEERQRQGQRLLVEVVSAILSDDASATFHDMYARRALLAPIYKHKLRLHLRRARETNTNASMHCESASHA